MGFRTDLGVMENGKRNEQLFSGHPALSLLLYRLNCYAPSHLIILCRCTTFKSGFRMITFSAPYFGGHGFKSWCEYWE